MLRTQKRALRRHHNRRIKAKIKYIALNCWFDKHEHTDFVTAKYIGKTASHHHTCGMCCNRRNWEGDTLQEKRHKEMFRQQLLEDGETI